MGWKIIRYPSNWQRASLTLRRIRGQCELCGKEGPYGLQVHHKGAPFPDGTPGNPHDKHDLRIENLQVLCGPCHIEADRIHPPMSPEKQERERQKRARKRRRKIAMREAHRSLGIGTGLVLYQSCVP